MRKGRERVLHVPRSGADWFAQIFMPMIWVLKGGWENVGGWLDIEIEIEVDVEIRNRCQNTETQKTKNQKMQEKNNK